MNSFIKQIQSVLLEDSDLAINAKGTNLLERIKNIILNNFESKQIEISDISLELNKTEKFKIGDIKLNVSIVNYLESFSKIKSKYQHDCLCIVFKGHKVYSIYDSNNKSKTSLITINKKMGLVLPKNTICSENIASNSIILEIVLEERVEN